MIKQRPLEELFAKVPRRYDLLNRLLTWRMDERWRRIAASECLRQSPKRVLDLCCGTGDLALHIAQNIADGLAEDAEPLGAPGHREARRPRRRARKKLEIVGVDFVPGMLELAKEKLAKAGLEGRVDLTEGDAAALPFPDDHFDAIGIAFAFRNLTWRNPKQKEHLAEMRRVLAPKGRLVIVETSQPSNRLVRWGFHMYLRAFAAPLGRLLSDHGPAYSYLAWSAVGFYTPDELAALLARAGIEVVEHKPLVLGCAAVTVVQRKGV